MRSSKNAQMYLKNKFENIYHAPDRCPDCEVMLEYNGLGEYKCPKCGKIYKDDFGRVREYLDEHRGATVTEIASVTGVQETLITRMLRDERLEVAEGSKTFLACEACGKPIRSGYYCDECAQIAAAAKKKRDKENEILDRKDLIRGLGKAMNEDDGKKRFERR
ncbi:MAG: hypothetical protein K6F39_03390 [Lachnospiraceae bacterium]|nr:hypothetical protein [Lachnospiraceae bacterium]